MIDSSAVAPNGNPATCRYFIVILLSGILFACAAQAAHWQPGHYGDNSLAAALTPRRLDATAPARQNLHSSALGAPVRALGPDTAWPTARPLRHWDNRLDVEQLGSTPDHPRKRSVFSSKSSGFNINKEYFARLELDKNHSPQADSEQSAWNSALSDNTELYIPPEFSYHPIVKSRSCRTQLRCGAAFYSDNRPEAYKKRAAQGVQRMGLVAARDTRN